MPDTSTPSIVIPSGEEIYNALMSKINPELLSTNIDMLDAPYPNETEEEHAARYQRYSRDFAQYEKDYAAWLSGVHAELHTYKKEALRLSEAQSRKEEASFFTDLESQMNALSVSSTPSA